MGTKSGVRSRIADAGSMMQPATRSTKFIISNTDHCDDATACAALTAACGVPDTVSSHEYTPAAPTMMRICEVRNIEFTALVHSSRQVMSRYTNFVTMIP